MFDALCNALGMFERARLIPAQLRYDAVARLTQLLLLRQVAAMLVDDERSSDSNENDQQLGDAAPHPIAPRR
jgi:cytochrome c peroxidase